MFQLLNYRTPIFIMIISFLISSIGCNKYLDERNNKSIVIPQSYDDLMALMDANTTVNHGMGPGLLEIGTDDYYLLPTVLKSQKEFEKENYLWYPEPVYTLSATNLQWKSPYISVFVANTVLGQVDRIQNGSSLEYNQAKGTALFLRAYSYFLLAQVFCPPFDPKGDNESPGLPLRTDSDISEPSTRYSVKDTYDLIINDLLEAVELLPVSVQYTMRPSQTAAYGALAKVFLSMEIYDRALHYADLALSQYNILMDSKEYDVNAAVPFKIMNEETIFFAKMHGPTPLGASRANMDTLLVKSYDKFDLRKRLFYNLKSNGHYSFKGSYTGFNNGDNFVGITTPELYLIKAECYARNQMVVEAKEVIKSLLDKRYEQAFVMPTILDAESILQFVLEERRKEMVFRGVRWSDLRRLNRDERFAKTLYRSVVEGTDTIWYSLPPKDDRYTYLIPQEIIQFTGMIQNKR